VRAKRKAAAKELEQITDLLYSAFLKIPKDEQKATIRAIRKIKIIPGRKTPKRSSTLVSFRQSSKAASNHRKRARP
jgi:hypothetical protein